VNDEELSVQDMLALKSEKSVPLASGGFVNITFSLFSQRDGTVVYIETPLVRLGISLVRPTAGLPFTLAALRHCLILPKK
jgi:hypothetical protein